MCGAVEITGENKPSFHVDEWLTNFEHALASFDTERPTSLFQGDCYRDACERAAHVFAESGTENSEG